mmetsp:Transcript_42092/g.117203  ORF Transcript_42092/g.117203 Transcript_42092/m.117203 type:complete len:205 (-) Transcript_42092:238-852(-)
MHRQADLRREAPRVDGLWRRRRRGGRATARVWLWLAVETHTRAIPRLAEARPHGDLLPVLIKELGNARACGYELLQKGRQLGERSILRVVVPCADEDPIVGVLHEVLLHVVDDDRAVQIPAKTAQVFSEERPPRQGMLPIEPVVYQPIWINLADNPVSVVLSGRSEDHQLILQGMHPVEKLLHTWPHAITADAIALEVMYQGLV